jgi:hypothetical protein
MDLHSFALLDPDPYWEMQIRIRIYLAPYIRRLPVSGSGCRVQLRFEKLIFLPKLIEILAVSYLVRSLRASKIS